MITPVQLAGGPASHAWRALVLIQAGASALLLLVLPFGGGTKMVTALLSVGFLACMWRRHVWTMWVVLLSAGWSVLSAMWSIVDSHPPFAFVNVLVGGVVVAITLHEMSRR